MPGHEFDPTGFFHRRYCICVYTVYTVYMAAALDIQFILSQTDGRPMYLQIMEQVQQRVAVGDWPRGSKLPSIRDLAVALNVSVITVKRAYLELERNGVIVTQHGKGSWIADTTQPDRLQRQELNRQIDRLLKLSRSMGLSTKELMDLIEENYEEEAE